jgi:HTH-type transcriptional regulator/antitoxin HipB
MKHLARRMLGISRSVNSVQLAQKGVGYLPSGKFEVVLGVDFRYDFPIGKYAMSNLPIIDTRQLGELIRARRTALGLRQPDLALTANVGIRFIVDIESGKETCQVGLTLRLLKVLGIGLTAHVAAVKPAAGSTGEQGIVDRDDAEPSS